jgi:hypothetical protein
MKDMKKRDPETSALLQDQSAFSPESISKLENLISAETTSIAQQLDIGKLECHDASILISLPGASAQAPHADIAPDLVASAFKAKDPFSTSVIFALEDNTSVLAWPGSHLRLQPGKSKKQ